MYRVCQLRNVPAAFQRFLGPDSGGFERFFPDQRMHRVDGTILIVRLRGRKAVNGAVHELQRASRVLSSAMDRSNAALRGAWLSTATACVAIALRSGKDASQLIGQTATLIGQTAVLLFGSRQARLPV